MAIENALFYSEIKNTSRKISKLNMQLKKLLEEQKGKLVKTQTVLIEQKKKLSSFYNIKNRKFVTGKSPQFNAILNIIDRIRNLNTPVLIEGETGTGKEVIANILHYNSNRKERPFITVNCSAIPSPLVESELFGHVKGAFTDAIFDKKGLFILADKGTLFLDEIGTMPLETQQKLFRVIEEKEVKPIGSTKTFRVDIRLICASNVPLKLLVEQNKFREDLYYRINVLKVSLPPLRERKEDIPIFVKFFSESIAKEMREKIKKFSPEALKVLMNYDWPGNIRELENQIRCAYLTKDNTILPHHFTFEPDGVSIHNEHIFKSINLKEAMDNFKYDLVKYVLKKHNNNCTKAAKALGISRRYLLKLISQM